jgi:RNA polymerase sigma-70 factor (ECF subfamily)
MDPEVLKKAQKGDEEAFAQIVSEHQNLVYTVALRILANPDDALDAAQDVFLRVWKSLPKFQGRSEFTTWLYRITANICLDYIKRRKRERRAPFSWPDEQEERFPESVTIDEEMDRIEVKDRLEEILEKMNPIYRSVLVLRDIYGFSYEEISRMLKISLQATKIRIYRARLDFKSKFHQFQGETEKEGD